MTEYVAVFFLKIEKKYFKLFQICPNIPLYELDDQNRNSADMTQSGKYGDFDRFCVPNNMSF